MPQHTIETMQAYLREHNAYYFAGNITLHYEASQFTQGFWGNRKGSETREYESLADLCARNPDFKTLIENEVI